MFTPRCSPRTRKFPRSVSFSTTYGCGATGRQSCPIFRFWPIFPCTKFLKRTLRWPAHSPWVTLHRRMITVSPCGSRRSKGVPSGTGDFLRVLVGDLGTPKLAQIFAYGKWLNPYIMLQHGTSDLDQRCLKMRNSEDEGTFPPNFFAPTRIGCPLPDVLRKDWLFSLQLYENMSCVRSFSAVVSELREWWKSSVT